MRILITGAGGGVGQALLARLPEAHGAAHSQLDVTDAKAVMRLIGDRAPQLVIHCAALTNVDRCAQAPQEALQVNAFGTQNVALACQRVGAALCYISTNEVFDGERGAPYGEYDPMQPANPYGYSKYVGEQIVRQLVPRHYIVRTSWVFAHNGRNFLQRIVGLAREGKPLSVVTDEVACPTYAEDLAEGIVALVQTERFGTYHLTNQGALSRYAFARAILDAHGMAEYPIAPIAKAQFNRPSRPPTYSALQNTFAALIGITLRHWRDALDAFIARERQQV
ncbi:MAG: dTDP-4-dehydrorhamnose reductase [Candidatus Thermofonsia Clade 1 bacterium]|jgi:dTDP-4-dehydrorhamnose reductase|uniref:dTDP-4-dehydrorhamnose reductase n=1 Tax=Candidatus Thermofonsia Clade 1 bacterium TaxID=2364210 RepID=A0A2M8PZZ1_9CHLR|nr:MAG: dTDP-4-dehydrorhamnose reductase [Candidatus Thermofonsia Clade 1 bacterium]PJF43103.1 MAG: dTDP-4-dehydrorhamnose reductase [Candidatus Thermofonsia Clade 1 bacterium]